MQGKIVKMKMIVYSNVIAPLPIILILMILNLMGAFVLDGEDALSCCVGAVGSVIVVLVGCLVGGFLDRERNGFLNDRSDG